MQKMNIIPHIVIEMLNPAVWFVESILAYNLRSRFFPDMPFSQDHIANYSASFKAQKVMLFSLKCQEFCFCSKFVLFSQLSREQIQFPTFSLSSLFSMSDKISTCKKLKKSTEYILRKICHRRMDIQTDGETNRTDFIGPLPQRWRFNHASFKLENNVFLD